MRVRVGVSPSVAVGTRACMSVTPAWNGSNAEHCDDAQQDDKNEQSGNETTHGAWAGGGRRPSSVILEGHVLQMRREEFTDISCRDVVVMGYRFCSFAHSR